MLFVVKTVRLRHGSFMSRQPITQLRLRPSRLRSAQHEGSRAWVACRKWPSPLSARGFVSLPQPRLNQSNRTKKSSLIEVNDGYYHSSGVRTKPPPPSPHCSVQMLACLGKIAGKWQDDRRLNITAIEQKNWLILSSEELTDLPFLLLMPLTFSLFIAARSPLLIIFRSCQQRCSLSL